MNKWEFGAACILAFTAGFWLGMSFPNGGSKKETPRPMFVDTVGPVLHVTDSLLLDHCKILITKNDQGQPYFVSQCPEITP